MMMMIQEMKTIHVLYVTAYDNKLQMLYLMADI